MTIGTDIVEVERFHAQPDNFYQHIFTEKEIEYAREFKLTSSEHFAGFFACKEAVVKALGCGFGTVSPRDIEVLHEESGKPYIVLYGKAKEIFNQFYYTQIDVSISHIHTTAIAFCVIN